MGHEASVELDMVQSGASRAGNQDEAAQSSEHAGSEVQAQAPVKSRSKIRLTAILTALFLSLFIAALDLTIIATAIPTISADLHSAAGYTWLGGAYLLASASGGPIWAKISDIFGRKPVLLAAVFLFLVNSIICAVSKSMAMLIVGRALQGVAGGGLILLVSISVSDLFSMRNRALCFGMLEAVWAFAGGSGPIVGGALTEKTSWRSIFWLNVPISAVSLVLLFFFFDVHDPQTAILDGVKAIDWFGSVTLLGMMLMLLLGLDFGGETFPWNSAKVICLIVFGSLFSLFFVYSEKRLAKYPLIPFTLFQKKSNVGALAVCFAHGFVFIGAHYYLPLFFQSVKGASPLQSGLWLIPLPITGALIGVLCGLFMHRTGRYRELIWAGCLFLTLGTGLYISFGTSTSIGKIIGFLIIEGLGEGLLFQPPLVALQSNVHQDDISTATATFEFIRNTATALSVVIGGVVFQSGMQLRSSHLVNAGLPSNVTMAFSGTDAAANVGLIAQLPMDDQHVVKSAFAWSLRNVWILLTCMAFLGMLASAMISAHHLREDHTETVTGLKKVEKMEMTGNEA